MKKLKIDKVLSSNDPHYLYNWVKENKQRLPKEYEELLLSTTSEYNVYLLMQYMSEFKKEKWPEAEPIILKDANSATIYASILGKRWLEAEPIIKRNFIAAFYYAIYVMKKRWVEVEPLIKSANMNLCDLNRGIFTINITYWEYYCKHFKIPIES
jgi:hypothetical protein